MNSPRALYVALALFIFGLGCPSLTLAQADFGKAVKQLQKDKLIDKEAAGELRTAIHNDDIGNALAFVTLLHHRELVQAGQGDAQIGQQRLDEEAPRLQQPTLLRWLSSIRKAGLIDAISKERLHGKVQRGAVRRRHEFLNAVRNELVYREQTSYQKLLGFAQQLRANGLLANSNGQDLIAAIDEGKVSAPFEMLDFCNNARRFSHAQFAGNVAQTIARLHKDASELLPDLAYTDFSTQEYREAGQSGTSLLCEMRIGDFRYSYKNHLRVPSQLGASHLERLVPISFYKIFNLALAEQGSLFRLHLVTSGLEAPEDPAQASSFGIIALRQEQLEAFRYLGSYYRFSKEDFRNALSRELVAGVIDRYFSFGMFAHLTAAEYRASRSAATSNPRMRYEEILSCFRGILLDPSSQFSPGPQAYTQLLTSFSQLSRDVFAPQNISETATEGGKKQILSFDIAGKTWSASLNSNQSTPDPGFFQLLDKATTTLADGRFYSLTDSPNWIFLNTEQWDLLNRQKEVGPQK